MSDTLPAVENPVKRLVVPVQPGAFASVTAAFEPAGVTEDLLGPGSGIVKIVGSLDFEQGAGQLSARVSLAMPGDITIQATCGGGSGHFMVELVVVRFRVNDVAFSGPGYHDVWRDPVFGASTPYSAPHWRDTDDDGDAADVPANGVAPGAGERRFPVCYVRNSRVTLRANLTVEPAIELRGVTVRVIGPSSLSGECKVNFTGGGAPSVFGPELLAGTVGDKVEFFNPAVFKWRAAVDGFTFADFGETENRIYVVFAKPILRRGRSSTDRLYETVLDVGCRGGRGFAFEDFLVSRIWESEFGGPKAGGVKRKAMDGDNKTDGVAMRYWVNSNSDRALITEVRNRCQRLEDMLSPTPTRFPPTAYDLNGIGTCQAFACLFHEVLQAQGVAGSEVHDITPDTARNPNANGILVRNWAFPPHIHTGLLGINRTPALGDDRPSFDIGKGFPNSVAITPGANRMLNSVAGGDDVSLPRMIVAGADGVLSTIPAGDDIRAGDAITPGPNGVLDSTPTGDDVFQLAHIMTGPDGICNSIAAGDDVQGLQVGRGEPIGCISPWANGTLDSVAVPPNVVLHGSRIGQHFAYAINFDLFDQPGIPAQGTADPVSLFNRHFVVRWSDARSATETLFDPSYGTNVSQFNVNVGGVPGEARYENMAIAGYYTAGAREEEIFGRPQSPAVIEVTFTRVRSLE